jgi:GAF domain-containing protein
MMQQSDDLARINAMWTQTNSAPAAFAELSKCLLSNPGYLMLTVSRWDGGTRHLQRVFSTDEKSYAVGGKKQKLPSEWSDTIFAKMKPHHAPDMETIRLHFDDHQLIESLGIRAILNIPIVDGAICLGTMNLMNARPYDATSIDRAIAAAEQLQGVLREAD